MNRILYPNKNKLLRFKLIVGATAEPDANRRKTEDNHCQVMNRTTSNSLPKYVFDNWHTLSKSVRKHNV